MKSRLVHPATLVLFVIALGFGLRLFHLDAQSFWYDEAFSAGVARGTWAQILGNDFRSVHPTLYYVILRCWLAIGNSDFTIRLLSTLLGVAGIAAMYSLGKALFDDAVGLAAAAITAIAPYKIYYSQEARMYTLVFLLSSVLVLVYVRTVHTDSRRWWVAYTAAASLALSVHYFVGLLILGLHLHWLIHPTSQRKSWRRLAISDALIILVLLPQLVIFSGQAQRVTGDYWISKPTLGRLFSAPYALTLIQFPSEMLVPLAFAALLLLFIITHLQVARELARRGWDSAGLGLLLWTFWCPLLLAFLISQWVPVYVERSLMVVVPALYLLLSWGAVRTRERYVNLGLLLLVAAFAMNALHNWYFDPHFGKPPFRTAAHFLQETAATGEPILHTSDAGFLIFSHYAPDCGSYLLEGDPAPAVPVETYRLFGGEIIAKEELSAPRFWLVVALDNSVDFQRGLVDWFDARYTLRESHTLDGIYLRHYDGRQDLQGIFP